MAREGFLKDKCGPRAKTFEHHWCRSRQIFGGAKDFCSNFPETFLCDFCL